MSTARELGTLDAHSYARRQAASLMRRIPHEPKDLLKIERYLLWSALALTPDDQEHPILAATRAIAHKRGWPS